MRKYLVAAVATIVLLFGATGAALGQNYSYDGYPRVRVVNISPSTAVSMYATPAWDLYRVSPTPDLFGPYVVRPGQSIEVTVDDGRRTCRFDILITSETPGRPWVFHDVDVCRVRVLNLL